MSVLNIIGPTEGIDQKSLEEYSRLFSSSSSLAEMHVKAMAALFGWATPEDLEEMDAAC
jgi:hypothetical protein